MIAKRRWSLFVAGFLVSITHAEEDGAFTIRGRVVDADAKPAAGATLRLLAPGSNGFDVDEKTQADANGRFTIAAPKKWVRMDHVLRQEIALVALHGDGLAVVQFNRSSAPPMSDVELTLSKPRGTKIAILSPDLRPVSGARVKITGLMSDMLRVDFNERQEKPYGGKAKKTAIGYVIGAGVVGLPEDLQMYAGSSDAQGIATVSKIDAAMIGIITVQTDEFGEQSLGYFSYQGAKAQDWPQRIVLKKTGRIVGQLSSPLAEAVAQRELTLTSFVQNDPNPIYHSSNAKVTTDREGKFEVPKLMAGTVRFAVKFDPDHPTRPDQSEKTWQLKAGETLPLKIDVKPAVRVEGRVLDAESKQPIRGVLVRSFLGMDHESTTSDAEGKFFFWMPTGQTAFQTDVPDEYLSRMRPSDTFDNAKRQQAFTLFTVPAGKSFEAPPIYLRRPVTLRGLVVDDQGKPLPGAEISGIALHLDRRTGHPKSREAKARTNERGEFTIAAVDPREEIRLRVRAKTGAKVVTIAKPGTEPVRIVIAAQEQFRISGTVLDAEGTPVRDAVLEIWHRDWRPPPAEAEPKKLSFPESVRSDAEGRFQTPPLSPDGHYRFTIRASGAKTTESVWLDATGSDAAAPQRLIVTRLGGLSGVVTDRAGKPIRDALVTLFGNDARTETATNGRGEFKLETPVGKPFSVIIRHPDFRVGGAHYDKKPENLNQTLVRLNEPEKKLARRPILTDDERAKLLKRLLEPYQHKLANSTNTQEKLKTLETLSRAAPEFVLEYLDKNPLQPAASAERLRTQVVMKNMSRNPEEAEELIGRMGPGAEKSLDYSRLLEALPEKERTHKLEILAEALLAARAEKAPELRALALGQAARHLYLLGEKDRATTLLREGERLANGLSTSAFAGYARGAFATELALIDLPAALALMKGIQDPQEFARHHGNTAHRIAGLNPLEAVKVLDLIPPPRQNQFGQRDHYAIRACYRMAQAEPQSALQLANSIVDPHCRAHALGVMAQAVIKRDATQSREWMRRAFALLEEEAARPEPPQLTSSLVPGEVGAALVLIAEQIDPSLVRECLWRAVALQRPHTEDPAQVYRYATANNALAMVAARYDARLAESLLARKTAQWAYSESPLAGFLANPQRAIARVENAPQAKDDRARLQLLGYLATPDDGLPRLILNTLGMWRIDIEDIDF